MFKVGITSIAIALAATACGKVESNPDGAVDPDASEFTDAGVNDPDAMEEVDLDDPDTFIDDTPPNPTNSTDATFYFSSDEDDVTYMCKVDEASFAACTSPHSESVSGEGAHTFEVYAIDAADNEDPTPASYTWTVDLTAPEVTISSGPANPTSDTNASFVFSANEVATFECRVDGGAYASCTSPASYTSLAADADHVFEVRATDEAGNSATADYEWTIDTDAPSIVINSTPANPTNSTTAAFTFTAEAGTTVACRLDSGSFGSCNSSSTMSYTGLAANVAHTFYVRATDGASNSATASFTWNIDTDAPDITILDKPADPTNTQSANFTFSVNEVLGSLQCRLDSGAWGGCTSSTTMDYSGLTPNTTHTFRVRGTDLANNTTTATYSWEIDTQPPTVSISSNPTNPTNQVGATFNFGANESASFECRMDGGGWGGCTSVSSMSYPSLTANVGHTFYVRGTDQAGNQGQDSYTWFIDTIAPDTTITSGPSSPYPVDYASITFTSNDAGASFQCSLDGGGYSSCTSPLTLGDLGYSTHTVRVRAVDSVNNVETSPAAHQWTAQRGLVLYYKFDDDLRNGSALGDQYDGVGGGFTFTTGRIGHAIEFLGDAESIVKIPDTVRPLSNDAAYTISMWVAEGDPQVDSEVRELFNFFNSGQSNAGGIVAYRWNSNDYELRSGIGTSTGATQGQNTTFYVEGWRHVIYEYRSSSETSGVDVDIFFDGRLAGTVTNPDGGVVFSPYQLESMTLGKNSRFIIDDLRVYNRVFNESEKCAELMGGIWVSDGQGGYCKLQ